MKKLVVIFFGIISYFSVNLCASHINVDEETSEEEVHPINRCLRTFCFDDDIDMVSTCNCEGDATSCAIAIFNVPYILIQLPMASLSCIGSSFWQSIIDQDPMGGAYPEHWFRPISCCDGSYSIYPFGFDGGSSWRRSPLGSLPLETAANLGMDRLELIEPNPGPSGRPFEPIRCSNPSRCMRSFKESLYACAHALMGSSSDTDNPTN
jgi:hypothetical protein